MIHPKMWDDQPDAVMNGLPLGDFSIRGPETTLTVEVRRLDSGDFFLTAGTLFASQTIRARNFVGVLKTLSSLSSGESLLIRGVELVSDG